ncbi:nuatigenin 3-beta-glucosyltransferase-like [Diospyros lotus]|uniref:nuatigenin 3-beta-glucosyltransferase-like n=1 Tax=Diospyros lotus TaxID=55363 RepID=UPI002251C4DD|nr:nuatigenin 3-beta-glucosyltransferase-like [Diospyros lotus]
MATGDRKLKLNAFFLPYFATSHLIPLVDTARLFASRGVNVTIITTPANAVLFQHSIDHENSSGGHRITVRTVKFPSAEVGVPEGIENFSAVTSMEMAGKVGQGIQLLQKLFEQMIREAHPDCIVSDMMYPWTADVAREMGIPRLAVYATNCFYHSTSHSLKLFAPHDKVQSETETFVIPGLPDKIEMTRARLQDYAKTKTQFGELINLVKESELRSYGIIFTSFSELEPAYVDHYKNVMGRKCWHIGLASHFLNRMKAGQEEIRNSVNNTQKHSSLSWLDNHKPNTVLYVCFGSMIHFSGSQLAEMASALEASGHPFVWVVRKSWNAEEQEEDWLPEGFEERMKEANKGLIIRDWAPQLLILNHQATGGFMTHCGWNSSLEGITAGVPLITWPLFAEQFFNEMLISRILKIGVEVGSDVWNAGFDIKSPVVGKDKIVKAITCLMGSSKEGHEMRRRAEEIAAMVKSSVEEGGSSYSDLDALIGEITACASQKLERVASN